MHRGDKTLHRPSAETPSKPATTEFKGCKSHTAETPSAAPIRLRSIGHVVGFPRAGEPTEGAFTRPADTRRRCAGHLRRGAPPPTSRIPKPPLQSRVRPPPRFSPPPRMHPIEPPSANPSRPLPLSTLFHEEHSPPRPTAPPPHFNASGRSHPAAMGNDHPRRPNTPGAKERQFSPPAGRTPDRPTAVNRLTAPDRAKTAFARPKYTGRQKVESDVLSYPHPLGGVPPEAPARRSLDALQTLEVGNWTCVSRSSSW